MENLVIHGPNIHNHYLVNTVHGAPVAAFEHEKDAKIFIAAPELLEALQACEPYMHDLEADNIHDPSVGLRSDEKLTEAFAALKAAIAKATA